MRYAKSFNLTAHRYFDGFFYSLDKNSFFFSDAGYFDVCSHHGQLCSREQKCCDECKEQSSRDKLVRTNFVENGHAQVTNEFRKQTKLTISKISLFFYPFFTFSCILYYWFQGKAHAVEHANGRLNPSVNNPKIYRVRSSIRSANIVRSSGENSSGFLFGTSRKNQHFRKHSSL